jgi:hypothetical protein
MEMLLDISLGSPPVLEFADCRLIATICFEIFAFSIAGLMALYFHKKNEQADKNDSLIEGTPGFRYTT